jgi:hypothetical protein
MDVVGLSAGGSWRASLRWGVSYYDLAYTQFPERQGPKQVTH